MRAPHVSSIWYVSLSGQDAICTHKQLRVDLVSNLLTIAFSATYLVWLLLDETNFQQIYYTHFHYINLTIFLIGHLNLIILDPITQRARFNN